MDRLLGDHTHARTHAASLWSASASIRPFRLLALRLCQQSACSGVTLASWGRGRKAGEDRVPRDSERYRATGRGNGRRLRGDWGGDNAQQGMVGRMHSEGAAICAALVLLYVRCRYVRAAVFALLTHFGMYTRWLVCTTSRRYLVV